MASTEDKKLGTPDIPAGTAVLTTYASTRISAPAALVFRTLRNSDTWRDWNRFVPRVTITYQPPEIDDHATVAEIAELIRNTSIAGSVDSDITDGAAPGTKGLTGRRMSLQEEEDVRLSPPPVTRERLRSIASTASGKSGSVGGRPSGLGDRPKSEAGQPGKLIAEQDETNGAPKMSAAQKFAASQASRSQSIASGETPAAANNVLVEAPHDPNILLRAPPTKTAHDAAKQQKRSSGNLSVAEKRLKSINALYGEPSIRIQLGTKMNLHCRMQMPVSFAMNRVIQVIVTEVSRPDDETDYDSPFTASALAADPDRVKQLQRSATHTLSKTGVYRIVWTLSTPYSVMKTPPKFMLQAQRVHEIRPVMRGDGKEECVYEDWECQKGLLAKTVKNRYGNYLQDRFDEWGKGLKGYCEAMGGAVERRDFVSGV